MAQIYKITVEMVRLEEVVEGREWKRMMSDEEAERKNASSAYGYAPQITQVKEVKRVIYTQELPELDVREVIQAVNAGISTVRIGYTPPAIEK